MYQTVYPPTPPLPRNRYTNFRLALPHNMRNNCGFSTVKMSHFDVMCVKRLLYSVCGTTRLYVPPNATALGCIKCTLGGITLAEPYNLEASPPNLKAEGYLTCYNTIPTVQSTPRAKRGGCGVAPNAPAVAGTYGRIGAPQPHFSDVLSVQKKPWSELCNATKIIAIRSQKVETYKRNAWFIKN